MSDEANATSRAARMEAAIALVVRAICLIETEGAEGAAFAGELQRAIVATNLGQQGL